MLFDDDSLIILDSHDISLTLQQLFLVHGSLSHQHADFRGFAIEHLNMLYNSL